MTVSAAWVVRLGRMVLVVVPRRGARRGGLLVRVEAPELVRLERMVRVSAPRLVAESPGVVGCRRGRDWRLRRVRVRGGVGCG